MVLLGQIPIPTMDSSYDTLFATPVIAETTPNLHDIVLFFAKCTFLNNDHLLTLLLGSSEALCRQIKSQFPNMKFTFVVGSLSGFNCM